MPKHKENAISNATTVPVLRDFITSPFFAASKQQKTRTLQVGGKKYIIGGVSPTTKQAMPALDARHAWVCYAILSFWREHPDQQDVSFSFRELCDRCGIQCSGQNVSNLLLAMGALRDTWIKRVDGEEMLYFPILSDISISIKKGAGDGSQEAIANIDADNFHEQVSRAIEEEARGSGVTCRLKHVSFSKDFFTLLQKMEEISFLRLDVFTDISSNIARTLYAFLPSRAYHHTVKDPFEITLAKLLEQIGIEPPSAKSKRKQIFEQHAESASGSILMQLDRKPMLSGFLRVDLALTADKKDYKLLVWREGGAIEDRVLQAEEGKGVLGTWLNSGKSERAYIERVKNVQPLDFFEEDLLTRANASTEKNRKFLELAKALLGSKFAGVLGDVKGHVLEKKRIKKNVDALLISRLMQAIEELTIEE